MTTIKGLDAILKVGNTFLTFKDKKPLTLLFIDWYENLVGIREHYEPTLKPKYIRCPGTDVCPLCHVNPGKYPNLKIKLRVYDPLDNKIKLVSLAKTHIQKLHTDFNLYMIDPTKDFVTISRSGTGANDTTYSAKPYHYTSVDEEPILKKPDFNEIEMLDISTYITSHSPDEIQEFMNAASKIYNLQQTQFQCSSPTLSLINEDFDQNEQLGTNTHKLPF
ncbi:hypothetical protein [Bacillus toyonensis]|uniref:hypothetical protein n=1 Tax=Bacillus toyonensis TaxID=155322 RepID=UPI0019065955|nr:hypothetical protein [Bacillus toyonensis]QQN86712.1 hypothetical protein I0K03_27925 [Bacillus toyonensis]